MGSLLVRSMTSLLLEEVEVCVRLMMVPFVEKGLVLDSGAGGDDARRLLRRGKISFVRSGLFGERQCDEVVNASCSS